MRHLILLLLSVFVISCGNKTQDVADLEKAKPLMRVVKKHKATVNVKSAFLQEVENWQELKAVDSFFVKFREISPNEALSNALELKDLVKNLKDSVTPTLFDTPSFKTRVNILYNETLRLADLTLISAIKANEVNKQVDKTIDAFSAVNTKINTVLTKKRFEDEIDIKIDYIGLDSTKIDSVSKKSIHLLSKEKPIKMHDLEEISKKNQ
ncbi:hypothetical protein JL193_05710 [Polaribacter batillariae]|uniref:VHS domain-containing protein n=1 Tax=Polaribacter batillariae TaxID=2808900 RepID=A0ABX7SWY6_9FLAO|nr:hypothetical protein [Polaribacter batillariae]QTD38762.1 hypothetical protein JL193_05710 [Polaribacter batillariae]